MTIFQRIHWRVAASFILLFALAMLVLGSYLIDLVREAQLTQLQSELVSEAQLIVDALQTGQQVGAQPPSYDALAAHWAAILNTRVTLISAGGVVLGESHKDRTTMENHLTRPEVQQALAESLGASRRYSSTLDEEMLYVAVPLREGDDVALFVRLALPLQKIAVNMARVRETIITANVMTVIVIIFFTIYISNRATRPLRQLTEMVQTLSVEDLDVPLIPETQDEVGELTHAFNRMADNLRTQIRALETERSKLAAVLEEMNSGVLIVDAEGQVLLMNAAASQLFEIEERAAVGKSVIEIVRNHNLVELWQQCKTTQELQITMLELSRQQMYVQAVATHMGASLEEHTLLLFQDLTRIRRLERIRRDFISNISHELRTPLASLKALAETLLDGALDDPPAARRFLTRMETEVDALTLIVQELLELSRIESGQVPLRFQAVRPGALLASAMDRLHLQAQRASLTVTIDCPDDLPLVLADTPRLEQVLVNLLHNAIKFTSPGGVIHLRASDDEERVMFLVEDNGVGIANEVLPRIFERFYKEDRARSSRGTGLGLSIAQHLVEAHGGKIWAESVQGQGSVFSFAIPVAERSKVDRYAA